MTDLREYKPENKKILKRPSSAKKRSVSIQMTEKEIAFLKKKMKEGHIDKIATFIKYVLKKHGYIKDNHDKD